MVRSLKFRAWSKQDKILHKPQTLQEIHSNGIGLPQNDRIMLQFIGLKDKNGKEIYEGDIIEKNKREWFEVIWVEDEAKFFHKRIKGIRNGEETWHIILFDGKVIGNIYENPELLNDVSRELDEVKR